jgi:hypothetical protein
VTNASKVIRWVDQSGNGFDVTQALVSAQPTLTAPLSEVNNHTAIRFDGVATRLTNVSAVVFNSGTATVFSVFKAVHPAAGQIAIYDTQEGSPTGKRRSLNLLAPRSIGFGCENSNLQAVHTHTNEWIIFSGLQNGPNSDFAVDYVTITNGTITNANVNSGAPIAIGSRFSGESQYFGGDLAELIVYTTLLSPSDRLKVERYLDHKYFHPGTDTITLPVASPRLWMETQNPGSVWTSGSNVVIWVDQAGNHLSAEQTNALRRPVLVEAVTNLRNRAALRFDRSVTNYLDGPAAVFNAGTATVFTVFQANDPPSGAAFVFDTGTDHESFPSRHSIMLYAGGSIWLSRQSQYINPLNPQVNKYIYFSGVINDTNSALYVNGQLITTGTLSATNYPSKAPFRIGNRFEDAGPFGGDLAELIIYTNLLSTTERQRVETYLFNKYFAPPRGAVILVR